MLLWSCREGGEDDVIARDAFILQDCLGGGFVSFGKGECGDNATGVDAELFQEIKILVAHVAVGAVGGDGARHQPFTGLLALEADAFLRLGETGEKAHSKLSLQVEDEVVTLLAHFIDEGFDSLPQHKQFSFLPQLPPSVFVPEDQPLDVGISFEQGDRLGADHPCDSGVWILTFQSLDDGLCHDDVANGGRTQDKNGGVVH